MNAVPSDSVWSVRSGVIAAATHTASAKATVWLADPLPDPPAMRGDPLWTDRDRQAPCLPGAELIAESSITDLFNKKGHDFVDLAVNVFFEDRSPAMSARLRAIYKLRVPEEDGRTR